MKTASLIVSILALVIAGLSFYNAWRSRQIAERADKRADKPQVTITTEGIWGNNPFGVEVDLICDRDLDRMRVVLVEGVRDGHPSFQGFWADQLKNSGVRIDAAHGTLILQPVPMGRTLRIVVCDPITSSVPKSARFTFRVECTVGDHTWALPVTTGDILLRYAPL